jgi:uncharacterized membrane protein YhhN
MRTWPLIPLYLVVLLANVAANLCEIDPLEAISKVLLMPTLIACLILNSNTHHWRHWFFGMGAFLTAHILYITTFSGILYRLPDKAYALGIPALLYGAFAIAAGVIAEQELVQPWRTAVTVYAAAVACMAAVAGVLGIRGVVGGLMFAVSDAMLATKKFLDPAWLPDAPLTEGLIMLSYGMAQFLLTQGFLRTMHCAEFDAERGKKFIPLESTGV